jgi:N-acetylmuramoyl-L-alanine amidase
MSNGTKILIDPGHGGNDSGAVGPTKLREKDVVLNIAKKLGPMLQALGITVSYTRTTDVYPTLAARYNQANREGVNYCIVIHANSDGPTAKGVETLVRTSGSTAHKLAMPIQEAMVARTNETNRGIKFRTDLAMLNGTNMPSVLPEVGFISNPQTEALMRKEEYLNVLAMAIRDGVANFLKLVPAPVPPVPEPPPVPSTGELVCPHCKESFGILIVNQP